jgi:hypothetical protein
VIKRVANRLSNSIKTGPKQQPVAEKRKTGSDKRGKGGEIEKGNAEGGTERERGWGVRRMRERRRRGRDERERQDDYQWVLLSQMSGTR